MQVYIAFYLKIGNNSKSKIEIALIGNDRKWTTLLKQVSISQYSDSCHNKKIKMKSDGIKNWPNKSGMIHKAYRYVLKTQNTKHKIILP